MLKISGRFMPPPGSKPADKLFLRHRAYNSWAKTHWVLKYHHFRMQLFSNLSLSTLDKALKMRDSVLLHSLESFLVTFPSISSETWVIYSSAISGISVFCNWLFLVFSGVSLETAANFLLFLNVAMILKEMLCQLWRLNWFFNFVTTFSICSIMR